MRSIAVALALACAPLTLAGACASFEQVAPKSPRAALAEAEIAVVGVVEVAGTLYARGLIDADDVSRILVILQAASGKLDAAHTLLKAGESFAAAKSIDEVAAALAALSLELSIAAEQPQPSPKPAPVFVPAPSGA